MTWLQDVSPAQVKSLLEDLQEFGEIEIQRRRWNSDGSGEVSSFVEAFEGVFDDSGLGFELKSGRSGLDAMTLATLTSLREALASIDDLRSPDEVIDDPAMVEVRQLALAALALLTPQVSSRLN